MRNPFARDLLLDQQNSVYVIKTPNLDLTILRYVLSYLAPCLRDTKNFVVVRPEF